MNALVVGYGSVGARHVRLLSDLGCRTAVVSGRDIDHPSVHRTLAQAIKTETPGYVIIADRTSAHHDTLSELARLGYAGTVLVEKPVFDRNVAVPTNSFRDAFVAYNLRFHPIIQRLKSFLVTERILSVQVYAGQYLPEWRPGRDYRASYSARAEQGGGALRDLSHELDYLGWILGPWQRVAALGGHLSSLDITSDDIFALMLVTNACPIVTVQLNYLDRMSRRNVLINTSDHTIEADLVRGTITIDRETDLVTTNRDDTYLAMHDAILNGRSESLCSLADGLETVRLIETAESAVASEGWICR